ncbi:two-component system, OmpR family, sensor kinase [Actinobaculum suis]|uniref:histidine kinase n=1 Tax=Actinobaculum suis TaxID=1657 RepID=A0A1G7B650_9ACTO|nr:HAMP domain-containing sensor histidine kinase [Actinobaculum suis]MDY5153652.1 HAMP domain-containing sensor histidine kinase [Actinobaculum suis]SDE22559.1 two-component system, OmpR family, sensor kinase [Actinobaculum suis]
MRQSATQETPQQQAHTFRTSPQAGTKQRRGRENRRQKAASTIPHRSLTKQLVAVFVVIIGAAILFLGIATTTLMRQYMLSSTDADLRNSGYSVADRLLNDIENQRQIEGQTPYSFSNYYIYLSFGASPDVAVEPIEIRPSTSLRYGIPGNPEGIIKQALRGGEDAKVNRDPFTVAGENGRQKWRALVLDVKDEGGQVLGYAIIAQPLAPIMFTVTRLALIFGLLGVATMLAGTLAVSATISRTLRSLRDIERATQAIAAGDLTKRVPHDDDADEVGSLATSINTMLTQIEDAFADKERSEAQMRQFASDASHELRTPLATVKGYTELYRMNGVPEDKVADCMGRIESEASRMSELVEDLLQLTRMDEGRPLELESLSLTDVAEDSLYDLEARAPQRHSQLIGLQSPEPPNVIITADHNKVTQVIANLLSNVLAHTPEETPVELAVGIDNGWGIIEVRDHGPGISPEDSEKIFQRFYRTDTSRSRASGGSGLGLAIVAAIMGAHGGSAHAFETPGGGLTVQLAFPGASSDEIAMRAAGLLSPEESPAPAQSAEH